MKTKTEEFKFIFKNFKKYIPATLIICFCSVIISLSYIYLAFLSKNILETASGSRNGNYTSYALLFLAVIFIQILCYSVSSLLKTHINGKFTITLQKNLFCTLNRKKYSDITRYHSGDILNRFTSDVNIVVSNTVSIIPDFCSMITKIIGSAAALVLLKPKIAFLIIFFGVLVPAFGRIINKRYKYLHKECQRTDGQTRAFLQECFENTVILKTFKSETPFVRRLTQYMNSNYILKIKRAAISVFSYISLYSFFTAGYYAILVWGAIQISKNAISFGTLTAFLQLVSQLRAPMQNISGIFPRYYSAIASAERLIELENLENENIPEYTYHIPFESLVCENIYFSYKTKKIFENFNLKIQKGSFTAITGASGSGKSTLFKLILGLYEPQKGKIKINDSVYCDAELRDFFAYVPQGNMILSGSIIDNITLCNPNIPKEKIISACKTAEIHDYIMSLPDKYDTVLNERGGGLSEGQIQRLAIARALLADTDVLLLDEATSALDNTTELKLLKNIKSLKDKTVILVTHRKNSIDFCDNIINI